LKQREAAAIVSSVEAETSPEPLAAPLAEWKLAALRTRRGVVKRSRLFSVLDRRADAAMTLIVAPAGFGKTQLLSSWLEERDDLTAAWVSLDPGDRDPRRFWTYVAHAIDRVRAGMARPALARLRTPGVPIEEAIDELMNGIATFAGTLVIVVDDLHHFASAGAATSLPYALDHLASPARLVATTRSDPVIRLGRLRSLGAVADIRADELVFTASEAKALIVDEMGIELTTDELGLLVERTEGWPAGLSLAGLWLAELDDPGRSVRSFSGSHRQVADYLVEEVLDTLDEETRRFLVQLSIFDRFSGPLCDAVLDVQGSRERLEALARSNLFVISLDRHGDWYRFHQLFRDLLALEFSREDEGLARQLHERAANWFAEHDMLEEALEHSAATGDPATVVRVLDQHFYGLIRSSRVDLYLHWLDWLPNETLTANPMLASAGVLALSISGQPTDERGVRFLKLAQSGARTQPESVKRRVAFTTEYVRVDELSTDLAECVKSGRRALELALEGDDEVLAGAHASLAYPLYLQGEYDAAEATATAAIERPEAPDRPHALISALAFRALVELERGHIHSAEMGAQRSMELARRLGLSTVTAAGYARLAMGGVLLELKDAAAAERHLERAETLRRASLPTLGHAHVLLQLARARVASGRLEVASAELELASAELDSFDDAGRLPQLAERVRQSLAEAVATAKRPIVTPTAAELQVLRLLPTDLTLRQIGDELYLSHNTVKTHSRNLYRKLGAANRVEAVRRAAEVGLLTPGRTHPLASAPSSTHPT